MQKIPAYPSMNHPHVKIVMPKEQKDFVTIWYSANHIYDYDNDSHPKERNYCTCINKVTEQE